MIKLFWFYPVLRYQLYITKRFDKTNVTSVSTIVTSPTSLGLATKSLHSCVTKSHTLFSVANGCLVVANGHHTTSISSFHIVSRCLVAQFLRSRKFFFEISFCFSNRCFSEAVRVPSFHTVGCNTPIIMSQLSAGSHSSEIQRTIHYVYGSARYLAGFVTCLMCHPYIELYL